MSKKHKSTEKRVKQDKKKHRRNVAYKKTIKTFSNKTIKAFESKEAKEKILNLLKTTIKKIDKCAQKGIIHKNTAARKKSTLMRHLKDLLLQN